EGAGWFVVTGRAQIAGREVCRTAELTSLYGVPQYFSSLRPLPCVVTRRIPLLITEPAPFVLECPEELAPSALGDTLLVPVVCRRASGFDGPVTLRVEGLPGKSVADVPPIAQGTERSSAQLKIAGELVPGRYTVAIVGEAVVQGRKWTNATRALLLEIQ